MTKLYTRRGDDGQTGWLGSGRLPKNHPIIEALGALDEASAALGFARASSQDSRTQEVLLAVQRDLYRLMTEISASRDAAARFPTVNTEQVAWLEAQIDAISKGIDLPEEFILPGDSQAGAALALARAVVRKAERRVVDLYQEGAVGNPAVLQYLNRLSSLLFVLELLENKAAGIEGTSLAREDR
jgi:cob(I)alamin adenosyltransferase